MGSGGSALGSGGSALGSGGSPLGSGGSALGSEPNPRPLATVWCPNSGQTASRRSPRATRPNYRRSPFRNRQSVQISYTCSLPNLVTSQGECTMRKSPHPANSGVDIHDLVKDDGGSSMDSSASARVSAGRDWDTFELLIDAEDPSTAPYRPDLVTQ